MMKYRKKPVVIEAMRHTLLREDCIAILDWCGEPWEMKGGAFLIPTMEGVMRADVGDWIIRGVKGEFYRAMSRAPETRGDKDGGRN